LASKELDLIKKKKQALDDLLSSGRISQPTYEHLDAEVKEALTSIEKYLETIVCKMESRAQDLEKQIGTLEIFLANTEMLHVTGEIDDETYEKQMKAINIGLEAAKQELNEIKSILEGPKPAETVECKHKEETSETSAETQVEETTTEETPGIF
jgi:hypothetical protein